VASRRTATVKELVKLWNSGDMDRFLESLAPDFEFTPDPSFPDAGVYRGDEMRGWMQDWAETWQDNELEILGSAEHGRAVILDCRWHLAAPQSGDEIPVSDFSMVLWFDRDGDDLPTRMAAFFDRERALQEAGVTG
jgi:ketosteroid isomerase-like protein